MAITTTYLGQIDVTGKKWVYGKSVLSGTSSSEDIVTGLNRVDFINIQANSSTPLYSSPVEDFPLESGTVTVKVSGNDATLYWQACGI